MTFKGYEVIETETGEEGVRLAQERRPSLVLMDIRLPVIDGVEALRRLRADGATRGIPVLAMTASVLTEDRQKILEAGFERPAFDTIVASGPNAALPHARPGERTIIEGDLVVLDFGGVYDSYCVDLTRTIAVGRASDRARAASYGDADFLEVLGGGGTSVGAVGFEVVGPDRVDVGDDAIAVDTSTLID